MRHLCDVNVFLAATIDVHPHHREAREWFDSLSDGDTAEFCRMSQNSFLRLVTTRVAENYVPVSNLNAVAVYRRLCKDSAVRLAAEPEGLEADWMRLAGVGQAAPKCWMDAYLAAFALRSGMRFVSLDGDFGQYTKAGLDLLLLGGPKRTGA